MPDTSEQVGINEDHPISRSLLTRMRLSITQPLNRQLRGMTLGSRVATIDGDGRFLLVKHTYTPGWIFPGGGVERGETCGDCAIRELREEAAVVPKEPLQLYGIFSNHKYFPGDHLLFYVLRQFEQQTFKRSLEIADARFFHPSELPERVDGGSRRRIEEIISGKPLSGLW